MGPQAERWLRIGIVAVALLAAGTIVVAGTGVGDQTAAAVGLDDRSAGAQAADEKRNPSTATASYASAKENDTTDRSVAKAGDVNGDGETDVLVGAPGRHDDSGGNGAAYLFYGPVEGDEFDVSDADVTFEGPERADRTGASVAGGDIDGDGYADVVIGASHANSSERYTGTVYVVSGGDLNGTVHLADANATLKGEAWGDHAGYTVDVVNDTAGNGSDVVVGAPYNDSVNRTAGAVYLLHGDDLDLDGTGELSLSDVETKYAGKGYGDRADDGAEAPDGPGDDTPLPTHDDPPERSGDRTDSGGDNATDPERENDERRSDGKESNAAGNDTDDIDNRTDDTDRTDGVGHGTDGVTDESRDASNESDGSETDTNDTDTEENVTNESDGGDAPDRDDTDGDRSDETDDSAPDRSSENETDAGESSAGGDGDSENDATDGDAASNETATEGPPTTGIETGSTVSGDEQEAETRRFEFEVNDGEAVRVTLPGGTGDVRYTLYGPDGEEIDGGVPSSDARAIGGVADASGTYYVEATAPEYDALGPYRFRVTTSADDTYAGNDDRASAASVPSGEGIRGTLFEGEDDWYAVELTEGRTYLASFQLTDSDTQLGNNVRIEMYDENGERVTPTDESGPAATEKGIENRYWGEQAVEPDVSGTYYVRLTGADEPGSFDGYEEYDLTVAAVTTPDVGDDEDAMDEEEPTTESDADENLSVESPDSENATDGNASTDY